MPCCEYCAVCRHLRKYLNEDIVKELVGDAHAVAELEKEWEQLSEDRLALRQIFPSGESKVMQLFNTGVIDLSILLVVFLRNSFPLIDNT